MGDRVKDKVSWISGGCSGMGLSSVELFVDEGAKVVVADIQDQKGAVLEKRYPGRVRYVNCDVTSEEAVAAAVQVAADEFGRLDIMFNNAGAPGVMTPIDEFTVEAWDAHFALLTRSTMLGMKYGVRLMKAQGGGGSIVNNASGAAVGYHGPGSTGYGAAKAAVLQMSKLLATELGPYNIRVNVIIPGWTMTSIMGVNFGVPREVSDKMAEYLEEGFKTLQPLPIAGWPRYLAEAVLWLGSDHAAWITGVALPVDGGLVVKDQADPRLGEIFQQALERAQASAAA
ncbi:MAG: SDR family NAD(P)-dependent oxidoreductase [Thermoleophilia bacterium]